MPQVRPFLFYRPSGELGRRPAQPRSLAHLREILPKGLAACEVVTLLSGLGVAACWPLCFGRS